ncbi:hypothetical protein IMG5_122490 [Ichthyophthirius multifiliis]|uniref:EGF-like domain-containing protein n=1 Tax=Ichthyophthirius multifiliis TaxID=5932 RepID=G0QVA4_ICHMU|nr:hypothetical protein IMG5_122490 [Ichthyophthirius multifiliis]EGR30848.1 hypothetical protein IMG5_122490 [Ichthyophthirius multifiliis]|eukprot:XP_004032435.1 hypothetical protein IMG5_122490 [Ichthyophthirius multifiliis]
MLFKKRWLWRIVNGQPEFGYITCPNNLREFCSYTPECPNYCSRKGICINGQCQCVFGWTDENSQKCIQQCPKGKFANPDKVCREQCPIGYFQDKINNICAKCDISCIKCSGPSKNDCLKCGFLAYLEEGKCVKQCSNDFQLVNQNTCVKSVSQGCQQECEKCYYDVHEECTECKNQFFLNLKTGKCVVANQCPEGTFANIENKTCQICEIIGCKQCISLTICAECDEYQQYVKKGDQCSKCPYDCQKCSSDLRNCLSCKIGLFLQEGKCVYQCSQTQFEDIQKRECVPITKCKSSHIFYYKNKCYNSCPLHTTTERSICLQCNRGCLQCYQQNTCYNCDTNNGWELDKNVDNCFNKTCEVHYCLKCQINNKYQCIQCIHQYLLYKNRCVQSCPDTYYPDYNKQKCMECQKGCLRCSSQECYECDNKNYYYLNEKCNKKRDSNINNEKDTIDDIDSDQKEKDNQGIIINNGDRDTNNGISIVQKYSTKNNGNIINYCQNAIFLIIASILEKIL